MKKIGYADNKNVIGARLREARKVAGLSQQDLAARMQTMNVAMDQQMLSRIERNLRIVTDYELACFCEILRIPERELLQDFYLTLHQ